MKTYPNKMYRPVDCKDCEGEGCDVCNNKGFTVESHIAQITVPTEPEIKEYKPRNSIATLRNCSVCSNPFLGKSTAKYCKDSCRKIGALYNCGENRYNCGCEVFGGKIVDLEELKELGERTGRYVIRTRRKQWSGHCSKECKDRSDREFERLTGLMRVSYRRKPPNTRN